MPSAARASNWALAADNLGLERDGRVCVSGQQNHPLTRGRRKAGAILGQVPRHTFSLWNRLDITPWWGVALGVITRSNMFASVDNDVVLPGYTRLDAAMYARLDKRLRLQVNVENMLNKHYFLSASNNNNITPGSPAAIRGMMIMDF